MNAGRQARGRHCCLCFPEGCQEVFLSFPSSDDAGDLPLGWVQLQLPMDPQPQGTPAAWYLVRSFWCHPMGQGTQGADTFAVLVFPGYLRSKASNPPQALASLLAKAASLCDVPSWSFHFRRGRQTFKIKIDMLLWSDKC